MCIRDRHEGQGCAHGGCVLLHVRLDDVPPAEPHLHHSSKGDGSPAPYLSTSISSPLRSTTVVASRPTSPESSTASISWPSVSAIVQPSVIGSSAPGSMSVLDCRGTPRTSSRARAVTWSGMRTPTVFFFGCSIALGASRVAGRMNVYGPGAVSYTHLRAHE